MLSAQDLIDFEHEIAECYKQKQIRAPIHLRSGCEEQLIEIFSEIKPDDWVLCYWASHLHCLLKGVPREELKQAILDGKSISLCFPKYNILCSGIVGSLAGVAVGLAASLKQKSSKGKVWLFTGDMGARCGIFHESYHYAINNNLPVEFVIEDNGISVLTNTKDAWGDRSEDWEMTFHENEYPWARVYHYKNSWPHSGISERVAF